MGSRLSIQSKNLPHDVTSNAGFDEGLKHFRLDGGKALAENALKIFANVSTNVDTDLVLKRYDSDGETKAPGQLVQPFGLGTFKEESNNKAIK